jgi:hypothetical protein
VTCRRNSKDALCHGDWLSLPNIFRNKLKKVAGAYGDADSGHLVVLNALVLCWTFPGEQPRVDPMILHLAGSVFRT